MAHWDVFHANRLEVERDLDTPALRRAFQSGALVDDDLVRPAGARAQWSPLSQFPELTQAESNASEPAFHQPVAARPEALAPVIRASEPSDFEVQSGDFGADIFDSPPTLRDPDWVQLRNDSDVAFPVINDLPPTPAPGARKPQDYEPVPPGGWLWAEEVEEDDEDFDEPYDEHDLAGGLEILDDKSIEALPETSSSRRARNADAAGQSSRIDLPVAASPAWDDVPGEMEIEDEADLSLSRGGPETVEELDLAPMVDVAFQLVLFFMVTATTVLYKTLEIPKPSAEQAPAAVAQGRSLADLQDDNVLVEIDAAGAMKIDREPVPANMDSLVERLRTTREKTNRKSMLLSADYATKHKDTVVVIDAAHEIGMNIIIARPAGPQGPAPSLLAQPPAAAAPTAPP